jgi:Family of unknown function (DUF5343)
MASETGSAPYAPPANVIGIVRRYRERNLPPEFDARLLGEIGVPVGNIHRTLAALKFLGLIHEGGVPTAAFESLQSATDSDYLSILSGLIKNAYEETFKVIDPSRDSAFVIDNHFRRYNPKSQRKRMVMLFLALCREAGLPTNDAPRQRGTKHSIEGTLPHKPRAQIGRPDTVRVSSGATVQEHTMANLVPSVAVLKRQYLAALIEKVKHEDANPDLLDRIEKLLSEQESLEGANSRREAASLD